MKDFNDTYIILYSDHYNAIDISWEHECKVKRIPSPILRYRKGDDCLLHYWLVPAYRLLQTKDVIIPACSLVDKNDISFIGEIKLLKYEYIIRLTDGNKYRGSR